MKYRVNSPRLGVVGDPYVPADGVNVAALIAGGFVVEIESTPKAAKSATIKTKTNKEK
jgi:hypothetical protein